jgi:transposase
MSNEIREKIKTAMKIIENLGYKVEDVSAKEFYDWMTGEIFSEDITTLRDVLGNEYLMIHELVEISELKKIGIKINKRVIVDSPKETIYNAHFFAQEFEMNYALAKKDYYWVKLKLRDHRRVLCDDPNLPDELRPVAQAIYDKFLQIEKEDPYRHYEIE